MLHASRSTRIRTRHLQFSSGVRSMKAELRDLVFKSRTWIPDPLEPGDPEGAVELPYQSDTDTEGAVPPPPSQGPSQHPATVSLTPSARFNGSCNRQMAKFSNRLSNRCWGHL